MSRHSHLGVAPVLTASPRRRQPARPRPLVVSTLAALAGLGLGITIALGITSECAGSLGAPGGVATAIGRMTGLLAAYSMVIVVLLVARVPPLERAIGQDRLVAWHRKLGPWPLYLLAGHALFIQRQSDCAAILSIGMFSGQLRRTALVDTIQVHWSSRRW